MTSLSPSRPGWGGSAVRCGLGLPVCVHPLIWGSRHGGLGGAGNHGEETECLAKGKRLQMRVRGVFCMPGYVLASHVRVSLSVCESLQQMPPPFLADHLTPVAALDSSLRVWGGAMGGGVGEGGGQAGLGGMKRGSDEES